MNKKTKALTTEQYKEIIQTMREGFSGCRPNERIATALVLEGLVILYGMVTDTVWKSPSRKQASAACSRFRLLSSNT